jgi:hypothetical protein
MQARLQLVRFPATLFAVVFAIAAALSLGAVLGYTLKPSVLSLAVPQVIVVHDSGTMAPTSDACIWIDHKKAC